MAPNEPVSSTHEAQTDQHSLARRGFLQSVGLSASVLAALTSDIGAIDAATGASSYDGPPRHPDTDMPTYGDAWTSTEIGCGGRMNGVTTCPSNPAVVYAWTDVGGAWRSNDKGETWYCTHRGSSVRTLSVHPDDEDEILQAERDGIYYSKNAGKTWAFVKKTRFAGQGHVRDGPGDVFARKPDNPEYILAAPINDHLFRSTDGGANWEALESTPDDMYPTGIWFHPNDPELVLLAFEDFTDSTGSNQTGETNRTGVMKSTDAGETWEVVINTDALPHGFVVDPANDDYIYGNKYDTNKLYRSTDRGDSWEEHTDGIEESASLRGLWTDSQAIYVANHAGIHRLPAEGDSWSVHTQDTNGHAGSSPNYDYKDWFFGQSAIGSVAVDVENPDIWYMSGTYGQFKSTDHGVNWTYAGRGIEEMVSVDCASDPSSDYVHTAVMDTKYFRLKEDGKRWDIHRDPAPHAFRNIELCHDSPDTVVASSYLYFQPPAPGAIWRSQDAGDNWEKILGDGLPMEQDVASWARPLLDAHASGLAIDPTDPDHIVVGPHKETCYETTDGGENWSKLGGDDPNAPTFKTFVSVARIENNHMAMSGDGSIMARSRGDDGGALALWDPDDQSWSRKTRGELPMNTPKFSKFTADPHNDGRFYLAKPGKWNGGVYRTEDSGQSWTRLLEKSCVNVAVDPTDPTRIAVALEGRGHELSVDEGSTWMQLEGDHLLSANAGHKNLAISGDNLVAGQGGTSYQWIPLSKAGQDTTPPSPTPSQLQTVMAEPTAVTIGYNASEDNGSGLDHYNVYVDGSLKATAEGTEKRIAGLSSDTEYTITVSAVDSAGNESEESAAIVAKTDSSAVDIDRSGWTASASKPDGEYNSAADVFDSDSSTSWRTDRDADAWVGADMGEAHTVETAVISHTENGIPKAPVAIDVSDDGSNWSTAGTTAETLSDGTAIVSFDPVEARHVRVRLTEGNQWGAWKVEELNVYQSDGETADRSAPAAPSNLSMQPASDGDTEVSWEASTDPGSSELSSYTVYVEGFRFETVEAETTTTVLSGHPDSYAVTVTATDGAGNESAPSSELVVEKDTTAPSTPGGLSSPSQTTSSIDLEWSASTDSGVGVDHYAIGLDGSTDHTVGSEATTTTITGLSALTTYDCSVTAVDSRGNESPPASVSVKTEGEGPEPIEAGMARPTDPDGDGTYEDVDGDGAVTMADFELLARHLNSAKVTEEIESYDWNGNGRVDYDDLVRLHQQLQS